MKIERVIIILMFIFFILTIVSITSLDYSNRELKTALSVSEKNLNVTQSLLDNTIIDRDKYQVESARFEQKTFILSASLKDYKDKYDTMLSESRGYINNYNEIKGTDIYGLCKWVDYIGGQ